MSLDGRAFANEHSTLAGKTILQILPRLDSGGVERTTVDIAEALNACGARAMVMCEGGRMVADLQVKGGLYIPFAAASKNPITLLNNASKLSEFISREGVDIVHARSRAPAWSAYLACKGRKVPFVTTYHGAYNSNNPLKTFYNSVMARGDLVIANSHFTASLILSEHRFAKDHLRIIPRGVDLRSFDPDKIASERVETIRKDWGVQAGEKVLLLAGRLTPWKGQMFLLDALPELISLYKAPFKVVFAGDSQKDGSFTQILKEKILQMDLSDKVIIAGHCTDMAAAYVAADVAVMPSLQPEAFGRVAVEAQSMGCPIVVTNLGAVSETVLAPPDVLPKNRTGWRIEPHDINALANSLREALELTMSDKIQLAVRSRAHVRDQFSLDQMVQKTLDVYSALLEG